ncbi:DNA ligase-associated DEXH box helicase [Agaricicola taiwanensis]|uniref:DNA ligase-associated DEXH box helicase n=1 Tax=Agaricicola taiwanensis TaxID=591372 RepID=A0A8J2YFB3_9RHOB|nr:ligase-associated DNA damage response DEXH box helicase [Agaricicola taiwanensis]GGE31458.1 DNA ligase-associated DEXH box helicase [Agaricicola taiwanensis]
MSAKAGPPSTDATTALPDRFRRWFKKRGWRPRSHQLDLIAETKPGGSVLLIAPTGAGKTLAGFLPSLIDLADAPDAHGGVHTLYLSPLKALAVDIARNLEAPITEMELPIAVETRTGDTSQAKRQRQKLHPPQILMTTPEQLALLLASAEAEFLFGNLKRVIVDELHAIAPTKRGDLLALGIARLRRLSPALSIAGLSATVKNPDDLRRWLAPQRIGEELAAVITVPGGARPEIIVHETSEHLPWSGHAARHAIPAIYQAIKEHKLTLVFVNTRFIAEFLFQALWETNDDNLPIALHHGSLDVNQRRKVEAAMAAGRLRAVICTATLDLGIDWGDVDLVVHMGSPKGSSRLLQRIGRANHRMDEPSKAIIVPGNRFEVIECEATRSAAMAGQQDTEPLQAGALDVLAQHVLGMACAAPFEVADLHAEITGAAPYRHLGFEEFTDVVNFVATGGYALKSYDRFARIRQTKDGLWRIANPRAAQQYRMNVGTIVEADMLRVRLTRSRSRRSGLTGPVSRGGRVLGEIEDYFASTLRPGDTFAFGGEILRFETLAENEVLATRSHTQDAKVPSYAGGRMPLTTDVAATVRDMIANPARWTELPGQVREWLEIQRHRSVLPGHDELLVETFPRAGKHWMVCYPFEGRNAHQTLGMLLTRRMERAGLNPLGFVANDYALTIWCLGDIDARIGAGLFSLDELFDEDMLGDDLEEWLLESSLMKRMFRNCAIIAGLIEKRFPGQEKTGRQMTISSDLIYDVLRRHEPDHLLLRAARADAAKGLLDVSRVGSMLARVKGRIVHQPLDRISPLAVPVILEIGREPVHGQARNALLEEASSALVEEAMGSADV